MKLEIQRKTNISAKKILITNEIKVIFITSRIWFNRILRMDRITNGEVIRTSDKLKQKIGHKLMISFTY